MSVCCFPCQFALVGLRFFNHNVLLSSRDATQVIIQVLHGSRSYEVDHRVETVLCAHMDFVRQCELRNDEFFHPVPQFDRVCCRSLERAKLNDLSDWLTALPMSQILLHCAIGCLC